MVIPNAHETHAGEILTKTEVLMIACWPGISQDVLRYVSKCKHCQEHGLSWGKRYLMQWPKAEVWERLHTDWSYVKDQGNILVIIDAGSSWMELFTA